MRLGRAETGEGGWAREEKDSRRCQGGATNAGRLRIELRIETGWLAGAEWQSWLAAAEERGVVVSSVLLLIPLGIQGSWTSGLKSRHAVGWSSCRSPDEIPARFSVATKRTCEEGLATHRAQAVTVDLCITDTGTERLGLPLGT